MLLQEFNLTSKYAGKRLKDIDLKGIWIFWIFCYEASFLLSWDNFKCSQYNFTHIFDVLWNVIKWVQEIVNKRASGKFLYNFLDEFNKISWYMTNVRFFWSHA